MPLEEVLVTTKGGPPKEGDAHARINEARLYTLSVTRDSEQSSVWDNSKAGYPWVFEQQETSPSLNWLRR